MDLPPVSQLPWAAGHKRFLAAAEGVNGDGACCLFVIDDSIPAKARAGYAALVIAYARADEPVTILADGAAALLIREGGVQSAQIAARRLIGLMDRLGLQETLRAGVAALGSDVDAAIDQARDAAVGAPPGEVAIAA